MLALGEGGGVLLTTRGVLNIVKKGEPIMEFVHQTNFARGWIQLHSPIFCTPLLRNKNIQTIFTEGLVVLDCLPQTPKNDFIY